MPSSIIKNSQAFAKMKKKTKQQQQWPNTKNSRTSVLYFLEGAENSRINNETKSNNNNKEKKFTNSHDYFILVYLFQFFFGRAIRFYFGFYFMFFWCCWFLLLWLFNLKNGRSNVWIRFFTPCCWIVLLGMNRVIDGMSVSKRRKIKLHIIAWWLIVFTFILLLFHF